MPLEEQEVTSNQPEADEEAPAVSPVLKFLVVGQGIAIVVLAVVLIGMLAYRAFYSGADSPTDETAVIAPKATSSPTPYSHISAPDGAVLQKIHTDDGVITLEYLHSESSNLTLIFVDTATGKETARVLVDRQPD